MIARQRPGEVGHHPARAEYDSLVFMHVVQQEASFAEACQRALHALLVEISLARAFEPLHHARFVAFGLQAADEPGARVRQALVVEIHGVLRREHEPETVGSRLFQQCQEQRLRWRVRNRRHEAENLVHVEDGAQARACPAAARIQAMRFVQQHCDEEHALVVVEMRDRHDRDARLAFGRIEQVLGSVQRLVPSIHDARNRARPAGC